jgi:hypothetical protein
MVLSLGQWEPIFRLLTRLFEMIFAVLVMISDMQQLFDYISLVASVEFQL